MTGPLITPPAGWSKHTTKNIDLHHSTNKVITVIFISAIDERVAFENRILCE